MRREAHITQLCGPFVESTPSLSCRTLPLPSPCTLERSPAFASANRSSVCDWSAACSLSAAAGYHTLRCGFSVFEGTRDPGVEFMGGTATWTQPAPRSPLFHLTRRSWLRKLLQLLLPNTARLPSCPIFSLGTLALQATSRSSERQAPRRRRFNSTR